MKKKKPARKRIFEIIQIGREDDKASRAFDFVIMVIIIISVILSICLTFDEFKKWDPFIHAAEAVVVALFSVEFVLRLWTADFLYRRRRVASALRYCVSSSGIVEIMSIIPFYMPLLVPHGLVAFRLFRVARILRLFQANSYSDALSTILAVLRRRRGQILSSLLIIFVFMIMSSILMYGFEHEVQPDVYKNAFSGIWWATSTLLTIGYGDIYPITIGGQITSIVITFLGVGMVAIPTGILSAGFIEHMSQQRETDIVNAQWTFCPHCGKKLPPAGDKSDSFQQEGYRSQGI